MPPDLPAPRKPGPGRPALGFVFLAAVVLHAWTVALPFRMDDWFEIPFAAVRLGLEPVPRGVIPAEAGPPQEDQAAEDLRDVRGPQERAYLFRPLLWTLFMGEAAIAPKPLSPTLFHAVSLLLHGLAAVAVYLVLARWLSAGGALLGTVLFAANPAGAQAVGWTAAQGDLLVTLFGLLATLAMLRARGSALLRWCLISGLLIAAAIGSKDSAYAVVPVVAGLHLLVPGGPPWRRRLASLAVLLAPALAAGLARQIHFDTWALFGAGGNEARLSDLPERLADFPRLLARLVLPWNESPEVADLAPWLGPVAGLLGGPGRERLALVLLALPALALLASPRWLGPRLVAGGAVLAVLALPPLVLFPISPHNSLSRAFYPLMPALAFVLGACATALGAKQTRGGHGLRLGGSMAAALLLLATFDAHAHVARTELRVGAQAKQVLEGISRGLEVCAPETTVAVIGTPLEVASLPFIGHFLPMAFRRPFRDPEARVLHFPSPESLATAETLFRTKGPLLLLRVEGPRALPLSDVLPPIPAEGIALDPAPSARGNALAFSPRGAAPARAARGLRVHLPPGPREKVEVRLEGAREVRERAVEVPASEAPRAVVVDLDGDSGWMLEKRLARVEIAAPSLSGWRQPSPPELLRDLPRLRVVAPPVGARVIAGTSPRLVLEGVPEGAALRARFQFVVSSARMPMTYGFAPERLERTPEGQTAVVPGPTDPVESPWEDLRFENLPGWFARWLEPQGIHEVVVEWRVEALTPDLGSIQARSPWGLLIVAR